MRRHLAGAALPALPRRCRRARGPRCGAARRDARRPGARAAARRRPAGSGRGCQWSRAGVGDGPGGLQLARSPAPICSVERVEPARTVRKPATEPASTRQRLVEAAAELDQRRLAARAARRWPAGGRGGCRARGRRARGRPRACRRRGRVLMPSSTSSSRRGPGVGERRGVVHVLPQEVVDLRHQRRAPRRRRGRRRRRRRRSRRARGRRGARRAAGAAGSRRPRCSGVVTAPVTREIDSSTSMLGKCPAVASRRREHDVAVEDRPGGVADRVLHVVALDEDGVEAGDAAVRRRCRPARAGAAAGRRRTAGSRGWRAARRPTGRSRAAPSRRGSGCPSSARRACRRRGTTRRCGWRRTPPAAARAAARRRWRRRRPSGPGPRGRGRSR